MSVDKRNTFLDVDESDDDGGPGYDSEADELRKGGRGAKRRKLDRRNDESDGSSEDSSDEVEDHTGDVVQEQEAHEISKDPESTELQAETEETHRGENPETGSSLVAPMKQAKEKDEKASKPPRLPGSSKPLSRKALAASEAAV